MTPQITDLIKTIAWPAAVIIGAVFVYLTVRGGNVSSISATLDGLVDNMVPVNSREAYVPPVVEQPAEEAATEEI